MSTMVAEVYEAFRSVGVEEGKARDAAEALHAQQPEELATKPDLKHLEVKLSGEIKLNRLMLAAVFAAQVIPLLKLFFS